MMALLIALFFLFTLGTAGSSHYPAPVIADSILVVSAGFTISHDCSRSHYENVGNSASYTTYRRNETN